MEKISSPQVNNTVIPVLTHHNILPAIIPGVKDVISIATINHVCP